MVGDGVGDLPAFDPAPLPKALSRQLKYISKKELASRPGLDVDSPRSEPAWQLQQQMVVSKRHLHSCCN